VFFLLGAGSLGEALVFLAAQVRQIYVKSLPIVVQLLILIFCLLSLPSLADEIVCDHRLYAAAKVEQL
jgi:hypothetical protein